MQSAIIEIKDVFNILFFSVAAIIAILTYIQARKTVFTPIKTETFKMQIKVMEEIFSLFQNKNESGLIDLFDENEVVGLNAFCMVNDYVESKFPGRMKVNEELVEKMMRQRVGAVVKAAHVERYFQQITPLKESSENVEAQENNDWSHYVHGMIHFTKNYQKNIERLNGISVSPLLPSAVKRALDDVIEIQHGNLLEVGAVLTALAPEMPKLCPDPESIHRLEPSFFWNRYNQRRHLLEPAVEAVLGAIRDYLQVENILS